MPEITTIKHPPSFRERTLLSLCGTLNFVVYLQHYQVIYLFSRASSTRLSNICGRGTEYILVACYKTIEEAIAYITTGLL